MTTRQEIITEARQWLGTPWHHQGYRKGLGCDCIGLIAGVALACGIAEAKAWQDQPEYHTYAPWPDARLLVSGCNAFLDQIEESAARLADVLLLEFKHQPTHFALISGSDPRYVIHALNRAGRVVEHRFASLLNGRVVRAYRYRGLDG